MLAKSNASPRPPRLNRARPDDGGSCLRPSGPEQYGTGSRLAGRRCSSARTTRMSALVNSQIHHGLILCVRRPAPRQRQSTRLLAAAEVQVSVPADAHRHGCREARRGVRTRSEAHFLSVCCEHDTGPGTAADSCAFSSGFMYSSTPVLQSLPLVRRDVCAVLKIRRTSVAGDRHAPPRDGFSGAGAQTRNRWAWPSTADPV